MRYRIFLDTNILLSGIYFEGNESEILEISNVDLITSKDNVEELLKVTEKKLKYLGDRDFETALVELEKALGDIEVLKKSQYQSYIKEAEKLIGHKKDIPILAAMLSAKPDYILTGDTHFFSKQIKSLINIKSAKDFLSEIRHRD